MRWHRKFFWALLIFLPTQLGYHFWPDWAMVLGRRVDYLAPTIYLTDILIVLVIVFWLTESISRIMNYELGIRNKAKQKSFMLSSIIHNSRFIILLLGLVAVNLFIAQNRYVAIYKWVKVVEFAMLGWYIVRTKPSFSPIVSCLSLGVLYSSMLAITQFVLQHSVGGPLWWLGERTFTVDTPGIARFDFNFSLLTSHFSLFGLRPYATFSHPNVLGGFLAVTLPLLLIRQIRPILPTRLPARQVRPMNETMSKIFQWTTIALGMIALLLTFSRSAIVVGILAIAMAIARIMNYELGIMKGLRFVAVAFIGIFVLLLSSYFIIHNSTDESIVVRVTLNDAAIHLWKTAPLFGVGLGNFLVKLPGALPTRMIYFLQPVHNVYLLLLSEIGVVGIGMIVIWIANRLNYEFRIRNYGNKNSKELFIIHTSLFTILLLGLVDHYPLTLQQGQLLFVLFLALNISRSGSTIEG